MRQYSFYNVDLIVDRTTIEDFPKGDALISVGRFDASHERVMDARGRMAVTTSADMSGYVSFSLLQTSPSIAKWRDMAAQSQIEGLGGVSLIPVPIVTLTDKMGGDVMRCHNGFIKMVPAISRGTGLSVVNIVMEFERVVPVKGSSSVGQSPHDVNNIIA